MTSPALQHALDRIDAEFGIQAFHANRKKRVRRVMRSASYFEVNARYGWLGYLAQERGLDLDAAIRVADLAHVANLKTNRAVRLYGNSFGLLNAETIFVVRSVLRWLRRHQPSQYPYVIGALMTPAMQEAAE